MSVVKVPSGDSALDEALGGGLPKDGLIVLAGNPGTGKTIFAAKFIHHGIVKHGEAGVYVSFSEEKETFFRNMRGIGLDFEELEKTGSFSFLDLITVKEAATPSILEVILSEVTRLKAKRLVIDSFTSLAQAFRESHEVRIILHTILSKITRALGCTTLLIIEVPHGSERIGLGIEEFVSDAIIIFKRSELEDGRIFRELDLFKIRGTPIPEPHMVFTLKDGFKAFPPFSIRKVEKPVRFQPRPDTDEYFSSGSSSLDEILGGGYRRGSPVLIEIDKHVSTLQYHLLLVPTCWNFITQGRGLMVIPSSGVDYNTVLKRALEGGISIEEVNRLLRICVKEYSGLPLEPYIIPFKGENIYIDYEKYLKTQGELMKRTGQPVLLITGVDTLINTYGLKETLSVLSIDATFIKETAGLGILLLKPSHPKLSKHLAAIADIHLKITQKYGTVLVYGVKPRTGLYVLEEDTSRDFVLPKLTPII